MSAVHESGVQDAATVLLLRDRSEEGSAYWQSAPGGPRGRPAIEVFVVERRKAGAFGGLLAFPGGKVDEADRDLPADRWTGLDLPSAVALANAAAADGPIPEEDDRSARTVSARDELGWHVAAVREVFEEVGVLLATRAGAPVSAQDLASPSFLDARARLVDRDDRWDWTDWLEQEELVLELGALAPWSWWVTPVLEPRRFDTRFFVAAMPPAQADAIGHDMVETVSSRWCTLQEVEQERAAGVSIVIYPTRRNLELLAPFGTAMEAVAAAVGGATDLRPCQPMLVPTEVDGEPGLVAHHPWDGTVENVL